MSNLVPAGQIYAVEKSGIGYAYQRRPSMDERKAPEYGTGAMVKVMDAKYGIAGMQLGVDSGKGTDAVGAAARVTHSTVGGMHSALHAVHQDKEKGPFQVGGKVQRGMGFRCYGSTSIIGLCPWKGHPMPRSKAATKLK